MPEPLPQPLRMWLDGITKGTPILFDMDMALALTEMLENAYRSHEEGRITNVR
jgi:hypothetical protein